MNPHLKSVSLLLLGFTAGTGAGMLMPSLRPQAGAELRPQGGTGLAAEPNCSPSLASGASLNPQAAGIPKGHDLSGLSPQDARKVLDGMSDPEARKAAIRHCLSGMPREKWKAWLEGSLGSTKKQPHKVDFSGMANRYTMLTEMFGSIAAVDPVGFMAAQNSEGQINTDAEHEMRVFVMMHWAEHDPKPAKAWLYQELSGKRPAPGLEDAVEFVAGVLMRRQEAGVMEWAATLPETERAKATTAILSEIASKDPREAAKQLDKLKDMPGLNPGNLAQEIVRNWAGENRPEALEWAAVQTGAMQKKGIAVALGDWPARDFDAALKAVQDLPTQAVPVALSVMLQNSAPAKASQLAGLVEQLPESPERAEATAQVMSKWTSQNPEVASAWMQRQPAGEIRDAAISSFVRWADVRDPEAALLWAGSMFDPAKRLSAVDHIIGQLNDKAPAAVQPWLQTNTTLTASEREHIQARLERSR